MLTVQLPGEDGSRSSAPFILTNYMMMFIAAMSVGAIFVTALYLASISRPKASENERIVFEYA